MSADTKKGGSDRGAAHSVVCAEIPKHGGRLGPWAVRE
jgi:hypothetical protein